MGEVAKVLQLPYSGTSPARMTAAYPSSFGIDGTTLGPEFDAKGLVDSERVKELEYRARFYHCTQHDHKIFDMDGRLVRPGRIPGTQPLVGTNAPSWYVPMSMRRPSAPYRIGKKIVGAFTGMLFGRGRFPQPRSDDPVTQDWAEALITSAKMQERFIRARNIGGSCGTVAVSWRFVDGRPRVSVHQGKHVHVHKWADYEERVVEHASEIYQFRRRVFDVRKKLHVWKWYWHRRDWTPYADVFFQPVEVADSNPRWLEDKELSHRHDDGEAHVVFIENLPDDEAANEDGVPDYDGTYEQMNTLDILNSVVCRGGVLNLDPTLVLKMEQDEVAGAVVKKGSDNALVTGSAGDAHYMELGGTSIQSGTLLIDKQGKQVLEVSECVLTDPDKVAAAGTSSVALKVVYAPMISKCDLMREPYGEAILRVLNGMTRYARKMVPRTDAETDEERYVHEPVEVPEGEAPQAAEEGGEEQLEPVEYYVDLPPRVDVVVEDGEVIKVEVERRPGSGRIWLEWGPYFKPTSDDHAKDATAAGQAAGGKPVLSQQTAVEVMAQSYDRDGAEEWARVKAEARELAERQEEGMFPDIGGEVPEGAPEVAGDEEQAGAAPTSAPGVAITATDIAKIVTVNEARAGQQLGPLMMPDPDGSGTVRDPDGELTVYEFTKKREEGAKAGAKVAVEEAKAETAKAGANGKPDLGPGVGLTPTDSAKIVTVREARAAKGLGPLLLPDGSVDPDMELTVEEYTTKKRELAEAKADIMVDRAEKEGVGQGGTPQGGGAPPAPPAPPRPGG